MVGPSGHVTATDISPAMIDKAKERLGLQPSITVAFSEFAFVSDESAGRRPGERVARATRR
jgi:hypothetical protein